MMVHPLWYQNGLQFGCRQCGRCCIGEPGYVWVNEEEITTIAEHLGLNRSMFIANFVRNVGKRKSIVEISNGDCIFFDSEIRGCKLYEVRPTQCRTWPFWNQNIDTPSSWKKTAKFCSGCNKGELHTLEEIEEKRKKLKL
ncbi:MAG: YkgJ family cysteine cluster protein [Planctomycetaceae bacterium]|nr:YkgJ family cysteine cluster protein [Planctomycetaceae bacterium]